jgi:hypothetical protein
VFTVESALPGDAFVSPGTNSWHLYRDPGPHPWIKEHLLNYGIKRIPPQFTKIAWLDADVLFGETLWPEQACELLDSSPIIQLFELAEWGTQTGDVEFTMASCARNAHHQGSLYQAPYYLYNHPGFGWAATRDFLRTTDGLFYQAGSMSGDSVMASVFNMVAPTQQFIRDSVAYQRWHDAAKSMVSGLPGYLKGQICRHLWHGPLHDRRYWEFDNALAQVKFNPDTDIQIDSLDASQLRCRRPAVSKVFERFGCC